jgi:hypothetical protein
MQFDETVSAEIIGCSLINFLREALPAPCVATPPVRIASSSVVVVFTLSVGQPNLVLSSSDSFLSNSELVLNSSDFVLSSSELVLSSFNPTGKSWLLAPRPAARQALMRPLCFPPCVPLK